jgi:hypothetical protein
MAIPDREWYSISGAAKHLEISEEDIEHFLLTGKLIASIKLLHTNKYLYEFKTYEEILDEIETDLDSDYVKFMLEQYDDYLKYVPISAMLQPASTIFQCGFRFLLQHKASAGAWC